MHHDNASDHISMLLREFLGEHQLKGSDWADKRKIETETVGDIKKKVLEVFRGLGKKAGISVLYLKAVTLKATR